MGAWRLLEVGGQLDLVHEGAAGRFVRSSLELVDAGVPLHGVAGDLATAASRLGKVAARHSMTFIGELVCEAMPETVCRAWTTADGCAFFIAYRQRPFARFPVYDVVARHADGAQVTVSTEIGLSQPARGIEWVWVEVTDPNALLAKAAAEFAERQGRGRPRVAVDGTLEGLARIIDASLERQGFV